MNFGSSLTHILSVIFAKTSSIVTMHDDTMCMKQVVSVTLYSVMYINYGGRANNCECQFFKCIFYALERNFTK